MDLHPPLQTRFADLFGRAPDVLVRAPGRVNLIGEHTDYNAGFVLPVAIDREVRIAARSREDCEVHLISTTFAQTDTFELSRSRIDHAVGASSWGNYPRGVAAVLLAEGYEIVGMDALIDSSVPPASGLSSSAALELGVLQAFVALNGLQIDPVAGALLCQRAENQFVGVKCGIMDQFASALGRRGHALFLDCRSQEFETVPLPADISLVITNSNVPRRLAQSAFNERRAQCDAGAALLGVATLRDATLAMVLAAKHSLPEAIFRRCRHVVTENQRVLAAVSAIKRGALRRLGTLLNESHASLRDDFAVSTPEIDSLVGIQQGLKGCLGARLTGAGFGGCTIALVRNESVGSVTQVIQSEYAKKTGLTAEIYVCQAVDGAGLA